MNIGKILLNGKYLNMIKYWKQAAIGVLGLKVITLTVMVLSLQAKINRTENAVLKQNKALRATLQHKVDSLAVSYNESLAQALKASREADTLLISKLEKYESRLQYLNKRYENQVNRIDSLDNARLKQLLTELSR